MPVCIKANVCCNLRILLCLYLHAFAPANMMLPYLRNFIHKTVENATLEKAEYEANIEKVIREYDEAVVSMNLENK